MISSEKHISKRKYRNNYIARIAWGVSLFILVWYKVPGNLIYFVAAYTALSVLWAVVVELELPLIFLENFRFFRITLDSLLYTTIIYLTGGINSFLILSYIIYIMLASLYSTRRFGIYAIAACITFYNTMLLLIHLKYLPYTNILGRSGGHVEINIWTVILTNFALLLVSVIMHISSHSLYKKLLKKTDELENERNLLKNRNEIIEKDLKLARKIQEQLIPAENPTSYIDTYYRPMDEVGGDLYDFLSFRDPGKIGIFLSDVSGHGVPASMITSMVKSMILQSGRLRDNPAAVLMYLNNLLYQKTAENFVTAFYGVYDSNHRNFVFSNAGHNPPFLLTEQGTEFIDEGRSIPLAIADNEYLTQTGKEYANAYRTFSKNDRLILYTDGLIEERGKDNPLIDFENHLINKILPLQRNLPGHEIINNLEKALVSWSGTSHFTDDVCIICLEII